MPDPTPDARPCPRCGAAIPADAAGVCPACALAVASGSAAGAAFTAPPIAELAPLFPDLELIEPLGAGAMGAVYRARQRRLERIVALKVIPADGQIGERFPREAAALARLNHPNLVAVYDVGRTGDWCWLVMEHVDGANLRQVMATGRMPPRDAIALALPLCDALAYAHAQGVVHRDIKPENILLDARGRPKLADFGLAKLAGSPVVATGTGQALGTPHYMAPEQVEGGRDVDARADLYALGVVLYELLTGGLPLGRFAAPSQTAGVDPRLDAIVLRLLEKDPAKRYPEATALARDLEAIGGRRASGESAAPAAIDVAERRRRDGVLLIVYAAVLAAVALGGALDHAFTFGGWTLALLGLVATPVIAWGGRAAACDGDQRWAYAARICAACALPVFFAWHVLIGFVAMFVVGSLFNRAGDDVLADVDVAFRGRRERRRRERAQDAERAAAAPPVWSARARSEPAPPPTQHIVVQAKSDGARIGLFGFLATIVRGVFHLAAIVLVLAAGTAAWMIADPAFAQRVRRAADAAGIELPRRLAPPSAAAEAPADASVADDPVARVEAANRAVEAAVANKHVYEREGDAERWRRLGGAAREFAHLRRIGDGEEASPPPLPSLERITAEARNLRDDARRLLVGWPLQVTTASGGTATIPLDPAVERALAELAAAWADVAERPALCVAVSPAWFAVIRRDLAAAPAERAAEVVLQPAARSLFTREQAAALVALVPEADRERVAWALRERTVDAAPRVDVHAEASPPPAHPLEPTPP